MVYFHINECHIYYSTCDMHICTNNIYCNRIAYYTYIKQCTEYMHN